MLFLVSVLLLQCRLTPMGPTHPHSTLHHWVCYKVSLSQWGIVREGEMYHTVLESSYLREEEYSVQTDHIHMNELEMGNTACTLYPFALLGLNSWDFCREFYYSSHRVCVWYHIVSSFSLSVLRLHRMVCEGFPLLTILIFHLHIWAMKFYFRLRHTSRHCWRQRDDRPAP